MEQKKNYFKVTHFEIFIVILWCLLVFINLENFASFKAVFYNPFSSMSNIRNEGIYNYNMMPGQSIFWLVISIISSLALYSVSNKLLSYFLIKSKNGERDNYELLCRKIVKSIKIALIIAIVAGFSGLRIWSDLTEFIMRNI